MNEYLEKKCIVCQKKFQCKTSPRRKTSRTGIRPAKSLTCSPKCTVIYGRVYKMAKLRYKQYKEAQDATTT